MGIRKNGSEASQDFWKSVEENLRQMDKWPDWKRNIDISASGSGYTDGSSNSKASGWVDKRENK